MKNYFWPVLLIFAVGTWLRFDSYQNRHPDIDELFELQYLQDKSITTIFNNKAFYGDHTSFPGEYLLYWAPLKVTGLFAKPAKITTDPPAVSGIGREGFWRLAFIKIVLFIVSFWLLYSYCAGWMNGWGVVLALAIYGFNYQLVYHAFELRPYSVLPVLAILNLWLCVKCNNKNFWLDVFHSIVIFFTCIYHAYGLMIAFLPIFLMKNSRPVRILFIVPFALLAWAYYAVYNHFGISSNAVQSQVDTFQYFPRVKFFENILLNLSGGSLIFYMLVPLLAFSFIRGLSSDDWIFLALLIVAPLVLIFAVDIKTHYWFHPRQFVWVIPFFAVFCGRQVDKITSIHKQ